jgi:hypothetical protein
MSRIVESNVMGGTERVVPVRVVTVDETVPPDRAVSIVQLDVEGFEQNALMGAYKTILRCKPILLVETLPKEEWLAENIFPLGYRVAGNLHGNTVLKTDVR